MRTYTNALLSLAFVAAILPGCNGQPENRETRPPDTTKAGPSPGDNLPQPYITKSARNFCKVLGWTDNSTPKAPEGFKVSNFGNGFNSPRWIYVLPNGDVLVAEVKREDKGVKKVGAKLVGKSDAESPSKNTNQITLLRDKDGDGNPELQQPFLKSEEELPFGMLLLNGYFYVAFTDAVWRYPYKQGETSITAKGEKILDLPAGGRHWTRNIIANKAGNKLYIAVGSASNVGEDGMDKEERRACILECDPDGKNSRVYASGLRNPVGMDWHPTTGVMWTAVNERDELGDDLVPDYLTSVQNNGFYGWPYSYFGKNVDPSVKEKDQKPELVAKAIVPEVDLGSHTSSLGLKFYDKTKFPAEYRQAAFIGQHGSWNRSTPSGYKVVYVPFQNGAPAKPVDFLTGFMANEKENEVYGRPVGVAVMADGSLLVADDAGNRVWRVSYGK